MERAVDDAQGGDPTCSHNETGCALKRLSQGVTCTEAFW
jgi:hypothetical protein